MVDTRVLGPLADSVGRGVTAFAFLIKREHAEHKVKVCNSILVFSPHRPSVGHNPDSFCQVFALQPTDLNTLVAGPSSCLQFLLLPSE